MLVNLVQRDITKFVDSAIVLNVHDVQNRLSSAQSYLFGDNFALG